MVRLVLGRPWYRQLQARLSQPDSRRRIQGAVVAAEVLEERCLLSGLTDTTAVSTIHTTEGLPIPPDSVLATFTATDAAATAGDFRVEVAPGTTGISPAIPNSSFELPELAAGQFQYNPTLGDQGGAGWTFTAAAGIVHESPLVSMTNPPAGTQAAFLQSGPGQTAGKFEQTFTVGASEAGWNTLSFFAEGRGALGTTSFQVKLDGVSLWFAGTTTVDPTTTASFERFISDGFQLTAGTHTLSFEADAEALASASFIDEVRFNPFYQVVQDTTYSGSGSAWKVLGNLTYPDAGTYTLTVTVTDVNDSANTFTSTATTIEVAESIPPERQVTRQAGLAGFYYTGDGRVGQLLQNGEQLTLVDPDGNTWAGTLSNNADLAFPGLSLTGQFDQAQGLITFSDSSVWSKVRQLGGQWFTSKQLVGSIKQLGTELTLVSGGGAAATARFISATEIVVEGWTDPGTLFHGQLTAGGTQIVWDNQVVWDLFPELGGQWTNANGDPTGIIQEGQRLKFVNKFGGAELGRIIDSTHVLTGILWGNVPGTIVGNTIQFANGTAWTLTQPPAGYPDLSGEYLSLSVGFGTRVVQAGDKLTFKGVHNGVSSGHFISPTEVYAEDWDKFGTVVGNQIVWAADPVWGDLLWKKLPDIGGSYFNQSNHQVGVAQLERIASITDRFGKVVAGVMFGLDDLHAGSRVAQIKGGALYFEDGAVWRRQPQLAGNWQLSLAADPQPAYVEQAGELLLVVTAEGKILKGRLTDPTHAELQDASDANAPVLKLGVPTSSVLEFDDSVEWNKFPPSELDNVFADQNVWRFASP